ncbi:MULTISPECIES: hypothetical protein [Nitrosomonas]|uniref:Uncharacterized protein n=3 Tax=Nitrosomonas communis TaxID=44574 RepID=A0A5D3YBZ1_9PROT|nr:MULTISPECIES: hypothetical protein [Nitrosomonas]TYP87053.1 hypothetical protein BCL69_102722 [Nitrosomonas communis]UVS63291.1 hypothetical protein NX761_09465 [Nitrosomonas sp. PLL12]
MICLFCLAMLASGCDNLAKGVTEAILNMQSEKEDIRKCYIGGRPFEGLEKKLRRQEQLAQANNKGNYPVLKVLVVHGIGSPQPGYSTRLAENLAQALSLNRVQETIKEITITHPMFPSQDLGLLRLTRYMNANENREIIFAELTWEPIIAKEKQTINFDNSGQYSFRRTHINNTLKVFLNDTIPDVMMFNGTSRQQMNVSVSQSLCWLMSEMWESLQIKTAQFCDASAPNRMNRIDDEFVFISHSLGSRITVDALQWIANIFSDITKLEAIHAENVQIPEKPAAAPSQTNTMSNFLEKKHLLQQKEFTVFMLSNQLPLLQMGQLKPGVTARIADICGPNATHAAEKLFSKTHLIAFSDPNDLFSYALPPNFIDEYLDSRLCPTLTNAILNVTSITDIFVGQFANPLAAHTEYDNDPRVIGLIAKGIDQSDIDPGVAEHCTWLESVPDGQ